MKNKMLKTITAFAVALMIAIPLNVQAKSVISSLDDLPSGYDPEINYAFPNGPDRPLMATIEEEGYYRVSLLSPEPTQWHLVYHLTSSQSDGVYVDTFSGKTRCKYIYCYPGSLQIYGSGSFYAIIEPVEYEAFENVKMVPVHRLYNSNTGEHFFTKDTYEAILLTRLGWTHEGIAFNGSTGPVIYRNYDGVRHSYTYEYMPNTEGVAFRLSEDAHLLVSPSGDTVITENEKEYWDLLNIGYDDRT